MGDPRDTYRWKQLRKRLTADAQACVLCGLEFIRDGEPRNRWSPSLDHIVPLLHGGDPFALENLQVVHYGCNASRGANRRNGTPEQPAQPMIGRASREW